MPGPREFDAGSVSQQLKLHETTLRKHYEIGLAIRTRDRRPLEGWQQGGGIGNAADFRRENLGAVGGVQDCQVARTAARQELAAGQKL